MDNMNSEQRAILELNTEVDYLIDIVTEHRKIIRGLMQRLQEQDSEECKKIHRECNNSFIYQTYYVGDSSIQET